MGLGFRGIILDSDNYEGGGVNHIGIPHERARRRNEALAEAEQSISRSELGKLTSAARIARPGAIYDASAAAPTFPVGKMVDSLGEKETFPKMKKRRSPERKQE